MHFLPDKLTVASTYGFKGIELFYDDLECLARSHFDNDLMDAASYIHRKCKELDLSIVCLQPFSFYEGLVDRAEHERLITQKLPLWFKLAQALDTDLIQVPSNFLGPDPETGSPRTTGDMTIIVSDLQKLADEGLRQTPRPIRFAYEALAWGNHIDTWEKAWEIVTRVDRPNFGICLDTFNIAGRVYADPTHPTGTLLPSGKEDLAASLARLSSTININKVFYIQIVDGERLSSPLDENHPFHVPAQPARMSWSRNARLFAFEEDRGGYLPVLEIAREIFGLGFQGWVSLELFSRSLANPDPGTAEVHARRGRESWGRLVEVLGLD